MRAMPSRLLVGLLLGLSAVWIALQYKSDGIFIMFDALRGVVIFIMGLPIVVMMIVSHNTHAFTPEGILAGVLTFAIEGVVVFSVGWFLREVYLRQARRRRQFSPAGEGDGQRDDRI